MLKIFYFKIILLLSILFINYECEAARCSCTGLTSEFTEDCCIGTHGELIKETDTICHFTDYTLLASFNRCCDSYDGKAECILG